MEEVVLVCAPLPRHRRIDGQRPGDSGLSGLSVVAFPAGAGAARTVRLFLSTFDAADPVSISSSTVAVASRRLLACMFCSPSWI